MAGYTINKTDNTILISDLAENTVDTVAGITLVGRSKANYGETLNENFVRIVENFANSSAPAESLVGQIWWDSSNELLKVKFQNSGVDASDWKPIGNPISSSSQPANPSVGDLWFDTNLGVNQLKLYNGTAWVTIGPQNTGGGGTTGLFADTIEGNIILKLSIASTDIAIFSNTEFTPTTPIPNFPTTIVPGVNFRRNSAIGEILTKSVSIEDAGILPNTDNVTALGASNKRWSAVYGTTFFGNGSGLTNVAASSATSATDSTNAAKIAIATDADDKERYITFVESTTGNNDLLVDTDITYNPDNNTLTVANISSSGDITVAGAITGETITSTLATGNPPFVVASTTPVANLSVATAGAWTTGRTVSFAKGDVTGSFTIDGSANVADVVLTIAADSVALGTDTTGAYISAVTGGTGVSITNTTTGDATSAQVNIGQAVATNSNVQFNNLGVGIAAATSGAGDIKATGDITAFASSDVALKENIELISNPIEKLSQIKGVFFDWKDDFIKSKGGEDGYFIRKRDMGVIAQDVQQVFPEIVAQRENGTLAVKYDKLVSVLIEAVKELSVEVNTLKEKLSKVTK